MLIYINLNPQSTIEPFRTTPDLTTGTCGSRCIKEPSPCLFSSLWRRSGPACRYRNTQNLTEGCQQSQIHTNIIRVCVFVSVSPGEPGQRSENFPELLLSVETVWRSARVLQHPSGLHCGQERGIPTETRSVHRPLTQQPHRNTSAHKDRMLQAEQSWLSH